jgi:hypothetical protein
VTNPFQNMQCYFLLHFTAHPSDLQELADIAPFRFAGRAMGVISREVNRKGSVGEAPANQALKEEVRELRRRLGLQEGYRDPFADLHRLRFKVLLTHTFSPLSYAGLHISCKIISVFCCLPDIRNPSEHVLLLLVVDEIAAGPVLKWALLLRL